MTEDYDKLIDMSNPKGNVVQTAWAFVGYLKVRKHEQQFPIGVYEKYCDGVAQSNAWMKQESRATRWEATKLYEELEDE